MNPAIAKLFHNRDLWIVVGGGAAAVTAVAVLSSRGAKTSEPSPWASALDAGQTPTDAGPSGQPATDDRVDMLMAEFSALMAGIHPAQEPASSFQSFSTPTVVSRKQDVPPPAYYVDRSGKVATIEEIFAQQFPVASPSSPAPVSAPAAAAPVKASPVIPIAPITWADWYVQSAPSPTPAPAPVVAPSTSTKVPGSSSFGYPISSLTYSEPSTPTELQGPFAPVFGGGGGRNL